MKGVVFTEFTDFVERQMGIDIVDRMFEESHLPSGGAYTSVGTYDHREMVELVTTLSRLSATPVPALLKAFGTHLLGRFLVSYPMFFEQAGSLYAFIESIDRHIHVEVRKLYPDAELPSFGVRSPAPGVMELDYRSSRGLADLAEGLLVAAIAHYGEAVSMQRQDNVPEPAATRFILSKAA